MKRGRRFNLLANVLVPARAILPTWLMVAGGKDGADLNAGQKWKVRHGNGRNADAVLAKTPNRVPGAV
jgi:hypothetical protein